MAIFDSEGLLNCGLIRKLRRRILRMRRIRLLRIVTIALVGALLVWMIQSEGMNFFDFYTVPLPPNDFHYDNSSDQLCRIPKLDVNAPTIVKHLETPDPLTCHLTERNWAFVENGRFYIADEAVRIHGSIKCNHFRFWRVSDDELASDVISDVQNGSLIEKSDFFRAECSAKDRNKWSNLFATIVRDLSVINRAKAAEKSTAATNLNVYILLFDSLSRLMFQRKLKRAYKFLVQDLEAVVLEGYNIVGDGTPQAMIPILTGQTELELPLTRKRYKDANYVDDVYPMIWRNFSDRGYVTMYAEDSYSIGTFTYRLKGFNKQPTDHYLLPFFMQTEKELDDQMCIGSEPQHVVWFRYGENFFDQYPTNVNKFALMHHNILSHNNLNLIELADDDLTTHLMQMRDKGHLNNTLLIVMADHGHRFAKLRETHQGQLEERLPFFSFIMPPWFRQSRGKLAWANLKMNAKRLTTPFDIHATLMDILSWPTDEQLTDVDVPKERSMSLWRPIPSDRICTEAGVEAHWCTCLNWESADGYESEVNATARALIQSARSAFSAPKSDLSLQAINDQTKSERKLCAELSLNKIVDAKRLVSHSHLLRYKWVKDKDGFDPNLNGRTKLAFATYQLHVITEPGHALYEATLQYNIDNRNVTVDFTSISRINAHGDRPHCIINKNAFLALYCVCYDKISL